jgi:hypothetical protein
LELPAALGPAADEFVVASAQAKKFAIAEPRATKDVDFVLTSWRFATNLYLLQKPLPSLVMLLFPNLEISNS